MREWDLQDTRRVLALRHASRQRRPAVRAVICGTSPRCSEAVQSLTRASVVPQAPGQTVDITCAQGSFTTAVASSPYAVRRDSANLDASIIDVVAYKGGPTAALMTAAPGDQLEVSGIQGTGFTSVVNSDVSITAVLEVRLTVGVRSVDVTWRDMHGSHA